MKQTYLIVAIEHDRDLPEKDQTVTDVTTDRLYCWLHARGIKADVRATRLTPSAVQLKEWEER